jgi:hypothetical protein
MAIMKRAVIVLDFFEPVNRFEQKGEDEEAEAQKKKRFHW